MDEEARGEIIDITDWRINGGDRSPVGAQGAQRTIPSDPQLNSDGMTYLRPDGLFEIYDVISGVDGQVDVGGLRPVRAGRERLLASPVARRRAARARARRSHGARRRPGSRRRRAHDAASPSRRRCCVSCATSTMCSRSQSSAIACVGAAFRAHGPVNLPIVLESLTSLRCVGDIDVDVKPGRRRRRAREPTRRPMPRRSSCCGGCSRGATTSPSRDARTRGLRGRWHPAVADPRAQGRPMTSDPAYCTRCLVRPRRAPGQRWCRACHAAYVRDHREQPSDEQRQRHKCRRTTSVLQQWGRLPKGPCEACGEPRAENHHHWGYDKPRWFVRLCVGCHRALEAQLARAAA